MTRQQRQPGAERGHGQPTAAVRKIRARHRGQTDRPWNPVALARALLLRPKVLILDDSTSAVDVETETSIQNALAAQSEPQTRIVVAQRISTVLRADKIIVLDDGRVVAQGTHAQLMGESAVYQEIYASQLGSGSAATRARPSAPQVSG